MGVMGRKREHQMELDDYLAFPTSQFMPVKGPDPGETWRILVEIVQDETFGRPVFIMESKPPHPTRFLLAWYTDDWSDAHRLKCRVGSCIAIKDGVPHHFMDGRTGFRIEDPATVEIIPCTMKVLQAANKRLLQRAKDGLGQACDLCDAPAETQRCARCRTNYCGQEHQEQAWSSGHKAQCKIIAKLREWNTLDWDTTYEERHIPVAVPPEVKAVPGHPGPHHPSIGKNAS